MAKILNLVLFCCLFHVISGQDGSQPDQQIELPKQPEQPIVPASWVKASNEFAFNLINEINPSSDDPEQWVEPKNVLFSPLGLASVLSMLHQGADGQTSEQLEHALQLENSGMEKSQIPQAVLENMNSMSSIGGNSVFKTANGLLLKDGIQLKEEYVQMIKEKFNAELFFTGSPEVCPNVNKLFDEKTDKNIPQMLSSVPTDIMMMLMNAAYFKGDWMYPFYESKSRTDVFYGLNETKYENVTMMTNFARYGFMPLDDVGADMVELPFKGDKVALYAIMPRDPNDDLSDVRSALTVPYIETRINKLNYNFKSTVTIPRLQIDMIYEQMSDLMKRLGLINAFSETDAKFSTMLANEQPLHLDKIYHHSRINLVETGAGVTSNENDEVTVGLGAQPVLFDFNHPFLYFVRHKESGQILLLGEVHKF